MDMTALARALDVLMSPLEWTSQDAWLAECLRQTRALREHPASSAAAPLGELEELLRLPGDRSGWLQQAFDFADVEGRGGVVPIPPITAADLPLVSLRCALGAGLAALQRLHAWRQTLGRAFDGVDTGMAIFQTGGSVEIARNARWGQLLRKEREHVRLREVVAHASRAAVSGVESGDDVELDLSGGCYRVVASLVPAGTLLPEAAILVLLDRQGPDLPTTQELRTTFGLRGREPQVALLAAEGLSNADIARRLRLSAHTVRHYLERVLERLGLHSRKALALRLMAAPPRPGDTPPPSAPH